MTPSSASVEKPKPRLCGRPAENIWYITGVNAESTQ